MMVIVAFGIVAACMTFKRLKDERDEI